MPPLEYFRCNQSSWGIDTFSNLLDRDQALSLLREAFVNRTRSLAAWRLTGFVRGGAGRLDGHGSNSHAFSCRGSCEPCQIRARATSSGRPPSARRNKTLYRSEELAPLATLRLVEMPRPKTLKVEVSGGPPPSLRNSVPWSLFRPI